MKFQPDEREVYECDLGSYKVIVSDLVPHTSFGWAVVFSPTFPSDPPPSFPWNHESTVLVTGLETSGEAIEMAPNLVLRFLREQSQYFQEALEKIVASQPKRKHALERLDEDHGPL